MDSRAPEEICCVLCSRPVNLQIDLCADENGGAIHDDCYIRHIKHKLLARFGDGGQGDAFRISVVPVLKRVVAMWPYVCLLISLAGFSYMFASSR